MSDWIGVERQLHDALTLPRRPVAVAFLDGPPVGVPKFTGSEPSGCSFWRLAAEGRSFYTVPADHYHCAIGSYTHNMPLPQERAQELEQTLGFMTGIGYVQMDEVPGVLRLPKTPGVVIYAPLGETPVEPDVVLLSGRPGQIMLAYEAAIRVGVATRLPMLGRPTCAALPAALTGGVVVSLGCIGNRLYTDLGEDELYVAIPGKDLQRIADELDVIAVANAKLSEYHRQRRHQLASE
jgi:uncharacterized protein (DUF169 family)